jgi:hypothetical protein
MMTHPTTKYKKSPKTPSWEGNLVGMTLKKIAAIPASQQGYPFINIL